MDQYGNHIITGDTQETNVLLHHLLQDNEMEVPLDKLKLPKMMPSFKLREILNIADKIETGEIDDQLTVNKDLMIVNCSISILFSFGFHKISKFFSGFWIHFV